MKKYRTVFGAVVIAMTTVPVPVFAAPPSGTPPDILIPSQKPSQQESKSDEHRIVGKVLQVDRARGLIKLATDEGVRVVKPPVQTLRAVRVGETISVPRSADEPVNASPRE